MRNLTLGSLFDGSGGDLSFHKNPLYIPAKMCYTIYIKATPHKARLTALHAICLQIFRHIAQKSLAIHEVCLRNFYAICRKI